MLRRYEFDLQEIRREHQKVRDFLKEAVASTEGDAAKQGVLRIASSQKELPQKTVFN